MNIYRLSGLAVPLLPKGELWNGVSKFIFYGRAGEISSNHEKAQTLSVMSLHLLGVERKNPQKCSFW